MKKLVVVHELKNRPMAEMARRHLHRFGIVAVFDNRYTTTMFELPDIMSPVFGIMVAEEDVAAAQDLLSQILPSPEEVDLHIDEHFDVGLDESWEDNRDA